MFILLLACLLPHLTPALAESRLNLLEDSFPDQLVTIEMNIEQQRAKARRRTSRAQENEALKLSDEFAATLIELTALSDASRQQLKQTHSYLKRPGFSAAADCAAACSALEVSAAHVDKFYRDTRTLLLGNRIELEAAVANGDGQALAAMMPKATKGPSFRTSMDHPGFLIEVQARKAELQKDFDAARAQANTLCR